MLGESWCLSAAFTLEPRFGEDIGIERAEIDFAHQLPAEKLPRTGKGEVIITGYLELVLDAIKAGDPDPATLARGQFYGHLYLGLYYEAQGNTKKSAEYIAKAAKGYEAHGYMGQVARVHHEWLQRKVKKKEVKPEK